MSRRGYIIWIKIIQSQRINFIHRIISDNYPVRLVQSNRRKANILAAFKALLSIKGFYDFSLLFEESYVYV